MTPREWCSERPEAQSTGKDQADSVIHAHSNQYHSRKDRLWGHTGRGAPLFQEHRVWEKRTDGLALGKYDTLIHNFRYHSSKFPGDEVRKSLRPCAYLGTLTSLHQGGVFSKKVDPAAEQYQCTCDFGSTIVAKETNLFYQYLQHKTGCAA